MVAFLDGDNLLLDADEKHIGRSQHLAASTASMIWLTSNGIDKGQKSDAAMITGLLRTLGAENPSSEYLAMDIDADEFQLSDDESANLARHICDHEQNLFPGSSDDSVSRELSWQDGFAASRRIHGLSPVFVVVLTATKKVMEPRSFVRFRRQKSEAGGVGVVGVVPSAGHATSRGAVLAQKG